MFLEYTNPSYRSALRHIKSEWKNKDLMVWPIGWMDPSIELNAEGIFKYNRDEDKIDDMTPTGILKEARAYERIWTIVPREAIFGVPHVDPEFLNKYINFLKQKFIIDSIWQDNKISVYLFLTHK